MASTVKTTQRSFAGGEVSAEMWGRIDDSKYQSGLATCQNFLPLPQGPIENRCGFEFVREVKYSAKQTRLQAFTFSNHDTIVLELGNYYIRFHTHGATLVSGSSVYEISSPWAADDVMDLQFTQSNDVLTVCHPSYAPREIRRYGALDWRISTVSFTAPLSAPTGVTATKASSADEDSNANKYTFKYRVTALSADKQEESAASSTASVVANLYATGTTVKISWNAVSGASFYRVYKCVGGIYGYIGDTDELSIIDDNISAETGTTPPRYDSAQWTATKGITAVSVSSGGSGYSDDVVLGISDSSGRGAQVKAVVTNGVITSVRVISGGTGYSSPSVYVLQASSGSGASFSATVSSSSPDYPSCSAYHEQRRCFAGTWLHPQRLWMTRSSTESDLSYHLPSMDDDRILFDVASNESSRVRHMASLSGGMVLLTGAGEWRVTSVNNDAITPSSISVKAQSYVGSASAQPVIVNNIMLYPSARGGHVRELAFNYQASGYVTGDLCLRAAHLFDDYSIRQIAFSKAPQPIAWFVSSSGKLLSLTYVPEQQVGSWAQHTTDGEFESCCVVGEDEVDALYVVVRRTINGSTKRYIERLHERTLDDPKKAFFVDSGVTYSGSAVTTISGLSWLEGKTVSVLADGAVMPQCVVKSGKITLAHSASIVTIGLPYDSVAKTLPQTIQLQDGSFGLGHRKNVNKVHFRVYRSSGIEAGPSEDKMTEYKQRTTENPGSAPNLATGEVEIALSPEWGDTGQIVIRQSDPLPLTLLSYVLETAL